MPGKVNEYSLGRRGVNVVRSPIHLELGDVTKAQNAYPNPNAAEGGLTIRGGLSKLNSVALAAGVKGAIHCPLPDPQSVLAFTLYSGLVSGASTWRSSTNGTSWAGAATPTRSVAPNKTGTNYPTRIVASFRNRIYYAGDDYTQSTDQPELRVWDGTNDHRVCRVPFNSTVPTVVSLYLGSFAVHQDNLYFVAYEGQASTTGGYCRVLRWNWRTGDVTQIGDGFTDSRVNDLISFQGKLWAAISSTTSGSGSIQYIRPDVDDDWTSDESGTNTWEARSLAVYNGKLYCGFQAAAGSDPTLRVRNADTSWSASDSVTGSGNPGDHYYGLVVYSGNLYAGRYTAAGTPTSVIRKYNGTAWSTDYDIQANFASEKVEGAPIVVDSKLYVPIDAHLLRNNAGSWSSVDADGDLSGRLGVIWT